MSKETWVWPDSKVTRVVDGDTFVAEVTRDMGFHAKTTFLQRMRLNRINAKPLHAADGSGKAAAAAVAALLTAGTMHIETVGPYKYGDEWMAEVTTPDGHNVSDVLVELGHAVHWDGTGPRPDA